jgi:hypothetical protein
MLENEGQYLWKASDTNMCQLPEVSVYQWKNKGVTPNGLVYDPYTIYVGTHVENPKYEYWKNTETNLFTPFQSCKKMVAIPYPSTALFESYDLYILEYLSRSIRLLSVDSEVFFWHPASFSLEQFQMPTYHTLPYEKESACWAEEVIGFLPGPLELAKEDIQALRSLLPVSQSLPNRCTIFVDEIFTEDFIPQLYPFLKEYTVQLIYDTSPYHLLGDSSLCLLYNTPKKTAWAKLWALPVYSTVMEFQQELSIIGHAQHLAHVAELKSWVVLLDKGSVKDIQGQIVKILQRKFQMFCP